MGLMVDTNVFIALERRGDPVDLSRWDPTEGIFISAVTVSELLMGVHRADNETRRDRRSEFVEAIVQGVSVLDFTTDIARRHAEIHAHLMSEGQLIGAHDLMIAATAFHHDLTLLTDNVGEFRRIADLEVIEFTS